MLSQVFITNITNNYNNNKKKKKIVNLGLYGAQSQSP